METVLLFSLPGFLAALLLLGLGFWIGHSIAAKKEREEKAQAMANAEAAHKSAMQELGDENKKKIEVLNKANANEVESLKQGHTDQIDKLNQAHQNLVDSIKSSHSGELTRLQNDHSSLITQLNETNNEAVKAIEQRRVSEIEALRKEQQNLIDSLRSEYGATLLREREENQKQQQELKERHAADIGRMEQQLAQLSEERDQLSATSKGLETTILELREEAKEHKLNNMFSMSKSGEKLIRVVRSVKELASELDETSRTVTGGDYSFFEQIKDQSDRETVLSLTSGHNAEPGDSVLSEVEEQEVQEEQAAAAAETEPAVQADPAPAAEPEQDPGAQALHEESIEDDLQPPVR